MPLHAQRRLDDVGMSTRTPIIEAGAASVTLCVEIPVRRPSITDDRGASFDPCIYNGLQSTSGSVRKGNEKRFTGLALKTTKHPLPLNRVAPMTFAPIELVHIDFDGLLKIADPVRAALQVHQHGPSAELTSVSDSSGTEELIEKIIIIIIGSTVPGGPWPS
jgi:hypothetical protein